MPRAALSLIVSIIGVALLSGGTGFSQAPSPSSAMERRQALDQRAREERMKLEISDQRILRAVQERAEKRASCLKQVKENGLSFYNRRRFLKQCVSR
jgi:hypothetical protein